jgi:hypothetical protein
VTPKFGVFAWRGDNRYHVRDAVKTYVVEKAADRFADKLNEGPRTNLAPEGYVVRTLRYCLGGNL